MAVTLPTGITLADWGTGLSSAKERRNHERVDCDRPAVCRIPATPSQARLVDVSHSGCRFLTLDGAAILVGATVHLDLEPGRRVTGQVMWSGPSTAGVRFNRALAPGVAVLLGLESATVEPDGPAAPEAAPANRLLPIAHWLRRLLGRAG